MNSRSTKRSVALTRPLRLGSLALLALGLLASGAALAGDQAPVVSVGDVSLSAGELAERLARVPAFQLERHGDPPEKARQSYVEQALVPELLMVAEARRRKLEDSPRVRDRMRDLLRDALERSLRKEADEKAISDEAVAAYYEENRARFETPKRVRIWRILAETEAVAKDIIAKTKGADALIRWGDLAREHSKDRSTALRNGDLGFVRVDGDTDTPRVKVKKEIVAAAEKLKDGAIAQKPVAEGDKFAVVWRRGSMPEVKRTLKQEEASIRQLLERRRSVAARNDLLGQLKRDHLKEVHPELLEHIDTEAFGPPPARKGKPAKPKGKPARPKSKPDGPPQLPKAKPKPKPAASGAKP